MPLTIAEGQIFASYDYRLQTYTGGLRPQTLGEVATEAPINNMHYSGGDLVASMGTGTLNFWREQWQQQ